MNPAIPTQVRRVPWITEEDLKNALERMKRMTREEQHQSLIDAGIIDEKGDWVDHPYGEMAYGPKAACAG